MRHFFVTAGSAGQVTGRAHARRQRRGTAAFTLAEALIASAIFGIFVAACLSAIFVNQICMRKSKEEAVAMDFLTKYVENLKSLPFDSVAVGQPISGLYDGNVHDGVTLPLIAIPANNTWVSVANTNYQQFNFDLLWIQNRNPQMQVTLTQRSVSGVVHDKEINVKLDWDSPLGKGGRLEVQVDTLRTANVPTL